jgi:hypothetical protein
MSPASPTEALAACMVGAMLMIGTTGATAQEVRILINFDEVQGDSSGGMRRIARTVEARLLGGNRIIDAEQRQGGGRRMGGGTSNESVFGGDFRPIAGRRAVGNWRVGPNNTLVRTTERGSDVQTIVVSLSGTNSCSASVTYRLKPGRTSFKRRGGESEFISVHAESISCRISG